MRRVDLYIGGTLGEWALRAAPPELVRQVVCDDPYLAGLAEGLGYAVYRGDPQDPGLQPGAAAFSVHYPRILCSPLIDRYGTAIWNLHPGLLPWGRGMYPVFWALYEGTPAGATVHELTARLDGGPIIGQCAVPVFDSDTGGALHARVQAVERELFERWLPALATGVVPRFVLRQPEGIGTYHTRAEFEALRDGGGTHLSPDDRARLVRALTFPGHPVPVGRVAA